MTTAPRVAIIGAGTVGRAFAAAARSIDWPIAAVASHDAAATADLAAEVGVPAATIEELLRTAAPDLAVVTAPVEEHPADLARLLPARLAVLVSSPLAATLAECRAIAGMAGRAQAPLGLAEPVVSAPAVQQLLAGIASMGAPLRHISAVARHQPPGDDLLDDRCDPALGGVLFHRGGASLATIVLAARIARWGPPTEVAASGDGGGMRLVIGFGSDRSASLDIAWKHDGGPAWSVQVASERDVYRAEIHPAPTLELNGTEVHLPGRRLGERVHPADALGFTPALRLFWDDVRAGRTPLLDSDLAGQIWQIVAAAQSATFGNTPVALPYDQHLHLPPAKIGP